MEQIPLNQNCDILCNIFKYLNGTDLYRATLVCRSWSIAGKNENQARNPTCIVKKIEGEICFQNEEKIKTEIIKSIRVIPSISLFYYIDKLGGQTCFLPKGCHCQLLPYNCYSVTLKNYYDTKFDNGIFSMFFPEVFNVQVHTVTLKMCHIQQQVYCHELRSFYGRSFKDAEELKSRFEPFLNSNSPWNCCLILLFNKYKVPVIVDFIESLNQWFPESRISVWGGRVHTLSVCHSVPYTHYCGKNADIVSIIMSGMDFQSWTLFLDKYPDSMELIQNEFIVFKKDIQLKVYSVGFMFTCETSRDDTRWDELLSIVFKEFFPGIPLVQIYGSVPISGSLEEVNRRVRSNKLYKTAFMVLTYN